MNSKPATTHVTPIEGGRWIPFEEYDGYSVHSIKFADGSMWDTRNGWRIVPPERLDLPGELNSVASMMQPVSPTRHLLERAAFELQRLNSRVRELEANGPRVTSSALEPGA